MQRKGIVNAIMKLTTVSISILLCSVQLLLATSAYSQQYEDRKISLDFSKASLKTILNAIEKKADVVIMFEATDAIKKEKASIAVTGATVSAVLNQLLHPRGLQWDIRGNIIRLYSAKKADQRATEPSPAQSSSNSSVSTDRISGRVTDSTGLPLVGVNVRIKGMSKGTITDGQGNFRLEVPGDATLVFSYVGYHEQEVTINGKQTINITLVPSTGGLNEVVVVGYGTQKKADVTGSVATINADNLAKVPVSSVTNALVGKLPGLVAIQSSGQPGMDASSLNVRGFGNALIIVDGVESNFRNIDASEIESVSILKDGAASIYGARAGNGVILVTTKRGVEGKPTVSFNGTATLQRPTYFQKMLSSGEYTTLASETYLQSGQPANAVPYTQEQIKKYYEAKEPGYYNTDWSKQILRSWAPMQNYNLSVRGGNKNIRYYTFLGTMQQGSFWKKNGGDYKRYNFQTNVDANILDNLTVGVTVSNIIDNINSTNRPQNGGGYLFADLYNNKPMYPASLPDPTKIPFSGSATGGALVQSNRELGGYSDDHFQTFTQSVNINYNFKKLKGLSLKAFGNYTRINDNQKSYARPVDLWTYNVDTKQYSLAAQYNSNTQLNQQKSETTTLTGQFSINYNNTFNSVHTISAMALYEAYSYSYDYISAGRANFTFPSLDQMFAGDVNTESNNGGASQTGRSSYVGRINYGYANKYLAQFILRADASAKFPPGSRWGYFPSASLGWRMGQENFLKHVYNLDELKLRASYGASGYDGVGDFQYLSGYGPTLMPALFGGVPVMGIASLGMPNPNLSWERISIYNAGIEYSFFKRKLYGELDVFYRKRNGIPARRTTSLPSTFGADLPLENLNSMSNRGFELSVGTSGKSGDWKWDVSGNISWQRAKWGHVEEVDYTDPDSKRINQLSGQWVDRTFGYKSAGLFTSQDQIDHLGIQYPGNPVLHPGDVKYVDVNKDGILDWKDQVEIGKGQIPEYMAGLNINVTYKDFDLSALIQGAFGYYKNVNLGAYTKTYFDNRWTEANNNPNALIPRLGGAGTNGLLSDRNFIKADYARLKSIALGYNLPKSVIQTIGFQHARVYVGATNIFTLSKLNKYDVDPESPFSVQDGQPTTSYYPQQKTIMLGVNISL
ncbi:TonB-dependent receptor [Chitinophaga sp. 212800010-3]|uniref:TonB-dependent receptor n=2 Tax=Chitinophaga TaxID=79328 RepID=UPI002DE2408A|nr:SusC/RagA family TonB-linked outer membrane protein [Chitinophaga sp. 212800010-3]